jgi:hypothetical protein
MNKIVLLGWILSFIGSALWFYGYLEPGTPPMVNWTAIAPWLAHWLPNFQSELGMVVTLGAVIPTCWPTRR